MLASTPMRRARAAGLRRSFARLCLLGCVALGGCEPSDPLEAVRLQQGRGDFEGSVEPLRALLAARRDDPEVLYRYGLALRVTARPSLAVWSLREAMEDPEYLAPAGLQLAIGAMRANDQAGVIEITTRIVAAEPDNLDALLLRANAYARSVDQYEKALEDVDRIVLLDPENLDAAEPQILALIGLDRIDEVSEAVDALGLRIDEAQLEAAVPAWHCVTAAIFAEESDQAELADERWRGCLERYPALPDVVAKASGFYDRRGEFDRSIEILRSSLAEDPSHRPQRVALAERLRRRGEAVEAEALLRAEAESGQAAQPAAAWLDLAKHYQEVADFPAAAKAAERAVELSRERGRPSPELMLEYADTLLRAGEFERALEAADEMTLDAHRAMIRARVAQQRGQPEQALEHFDEAFRLWPDNSWARYYAALAAEAIGDFDRAIEEYRYSIRIAPAATDARTRVARLHLAEGRAPEALQLLRVKLQEAPLDLDGEVLMLRLWGRLGRVDPVLSRLALIASRAPERAAEALASAAEGLSERRGPAAALSLLRSDRTEFLDFEEPRNARALRALVRFAHLAGEPEVAEAAVRAALAAHSDSAALHEIQGFDLELRSAPEDSIQAAYERAVALEPRSAEALAGLGRLALERSPDEAQALFDRAAAADPSLAEPRREAAAILIASGRDREAEERLKALLGVHPTDAVAAARLVELRLARDVSDDRSLELARRAVRFGRSAEALDLLSRVYEQRDDPERAREAAGNAKKLRERRAAAADGSSTPSTTTGTGPSVTGPSVPVTGPSVPSTGPSVPSPEGADPTG